MEKMVKDVRSFIYLTIVFYVAWRIGVILYEWATGLEEEVTAAAITALVGFAGLIYVQWSAKAKQISDSHRPAKIEVYEIFFDIVEHFMTSETSEVANSDPDLDELPDELKEQFTKLSRGMIVWASPQVIRAWSDFREKAYNAVSAKDTLLAVDKVLQAIRADLGNSNFGLSHGDVVKLYLSKPKEAGL